MARTVHLGPKRPAKPPPKAGEFERLVAAELKTDGSSISVTEMLARSATLLQELRAELMPTQLAFLTDTARKKAAICTRRAGKTYVVRHMLLEFVLNHPWTNRRKAQPIVQFIATTRTKAKDLVWAPLKDLCERIGLEAYWHDQEGYADFPNGVRLRLGGADNVPDIEKYRGDAYPLVVIDESASFGPKMENLVMSALSAALMDYDGTLCMVGTPGEAQAGYFYEIFSGSRPEWSVHKWSYFTNVHFPAHIRTVEWIEKNEGPIDSPRIQREYFGNWVPDASSLVYRFNPDTLRWDGLLPKGHEWRYVMGIDLGFRDPTAFVIGAYSRTHPYLYVVHAEAHQHMLPTQIADKVLSLKSRFEITRIVVDTGGSMARNNMEEWNRRYGFGMVPAEKPKKLEYIEHLNSELHLGRIRMSLDNPLVQEWRQLIWAPQDSYIVRNDNKPKEHPGFPNHLSDAFLYLFKESLHYRSKTPEPEPGYGEPGYYDHQAAKAKQSAFAKAFAKLRQWDYNKL